MNRREFVSRSIGAASAGLLMDGAGGMKAMAATAGLATQPAPRIVPMLYGIPRHDTNLKAWFRDMKAWGVKQWMPFAIPNRLRTDEEPYNPVHSIPFLVEACPKFRPYLDQASLTREEADIREMERLAAENGIEFWYLLPFPLFPSLNDDVVRKAAPEFFPSGKFTLQQPRLAELLKTEIRVLKKALPTLKGVNIWMAEGVTSSILMGAVGQEIKQNKEWETPLLQALDEVTQELGIKGMVFAHHYLHTVETHRNVYEMLSERPELIVMDDITWPEEDMLHPFLGYLPPADKKLMFENNPVAVNALIDTEYIGQGVLPSVYPRWWRYNIKEAVRSGANVAMGRTFFYDGGLTDVNFNRFNAEIFTRLCYDPDLDLHKALGEAAREMLGSRVPQRLIDILWETEPVLREIIGTNGVDCFDHSRFPSPTYIDILYTGGSAMKAIDDLFSPPGTRLYPPLTDDLHNLKQWRWQNRTTSKPADVYLAKKKAAAQWVESVLPEVRSLSSNLAANHREMFLQGYGLMDIAAKGMVLYVEAATLHYDWGHRKIVRDPEARVRFNQLAASFRELAGKTPERGLFYKKAILRCADFLEHNLPRLSSRTCG